MNLLIHFLGFLGPFTFSLPFIVPMDLLFHSLGFLGLFTPSLPLLILVGLLAINSVISACWASFFISLLFFPFPPFYLFGFFYCWTICQKWASTIFISFLSETAFLKISNKHRTKLYNILIIQ